MEKFTKANAYAFLNNLVAELLETDEGGNLVHGVEDIKKEFTSQIKENFEPQAGGGASKNPSYKGEDGVMMHYCRFKQCFVPEPQMNMFNGKSKGASTLAALHDYQIGKKVKQLQADALQKFKDGDYADGASLSTKADELNATREIKSTYDDENLQYLVKEDDVAEEATTNEASTEAVETDGEKS